MSKSKEYYQQYYQKNKERIKQYNLNRYQENKESIKERMKHYYNDNKERIKLYNSMYWHINFFKIMTKRHERNDDTIEYMRTYYKMCNDSYFKRLNLKRLKYEKKCRGYAPTLHSINENIIVEFN